MTMILILHANLGIGPFDLEQGLSNDGGIDYFRVLIQAICIVGVNSFVLISGWFGIKPSVKGLAALYFQLTFYSLSIALYHSIFIRTPFSIKDLFFSCIGGSSYWFVPSYLIMYLLSPYLNAFLDKASKKNLVLSIVAFFVAQQFYGRFGGDMGHFHGGYSALSFIGLYLLAGYARRFPHKITRMSATAHFGIFMGFTLLMFGLICYFKNPIIDGGHSIFHYNHPIVILSSFSLFLAFTQIPLKSKFVNWMASSAFAIYLIHDNFLLRGGYQSFMNHLFYNTPSPVSAFFYVFAVILVIGLVCILIDKIRQFLWRNILRGYDRLRILKYNK